MQHLAHRLVSLLAASGLVLAVTALAAPAQAASAYVVRLSTNKTSLDYGSTLTLSGRVTKGPVKGRSVTLYFTRASEDDSWHRIGRAKLSGTGRFKRVYKPRFGGDIRFLAVKARTGAHAAGNATSRVTEVYQWQSIWGYYDNGLNVTDGSNGATARRGPATIHGRHYKGAVLIDDGASVGFTTFECKAMRGLVGVSQGSSATEGTLFFGQQGFPFSALQATRSHTAFAYGSDLDPSAGVTIGATIGGSGGTTNEMVLAAPQVLCDAPA